MIRLPLVPLKTKRSPADGEHVAEDEHPDHQNWINRGAAKVGVVGRQLAVHPRQVQHSRDPRTRARDARP